MDNLDISVESLLRINSKVSSLDGFLIYTDNLNIEYNIQQFVLIYDGPSLVGSVVTYEDASAVKVCVDLLYGSGFYTCYVVPAVDTLTCSCLGMNTVAIGITAGVTSVVFMCSCDERLFALCDSMEYLAYEILESRKNYGFLLQDSYLYLKTEEVPVRIESFSISKNQLKIYVQGFRKPINIPIRDITNRLGVKIECSRNGISIRKFLAPCLRIPIVY